MKDKKKIERFIEMKAKNHTLDEMAKELSVDYETLARWNGEYRFEIKNKRALLQEGMDEKYYLNNHKKIELFGDILVTLNDEVKKRDFKDIPTDKLLEFIPKYHTILKEIYFSPPAYMTSTEIEFEKNRKEEPLPTFPDLDIFGKYKTY